MYLDTDIANYIPEYWGDGVPASSVRTREFEPDFNVYRNMIIQPYDNTYRQYLLNEKLRILYSDPPKYHRSRLDMSDDTFYKSILSRHVDGQYSSLFHMCMAMPSDLVICQKQDSGEYEIDFVHLVFPNGWGADDAIGKNFHYFHEEVKDRKGKNVLPTNNKFPEHFATSGKIYERVGAFSLRGFTKLDLHHSEAYNETNHTGMYVRFERQVIWSIPEKEAFMFFIQTNFVDLKSRPALIHHALTNADENSRIAQHYDIEYALKYLETHLAEDKT